MSLAYFVVLMLSFWMAGFLYIRTMKRREHFIGRCVFVAVVGSVLLGVCGYFFIVQGNCWDKIGWIAGFFAMAGYLYFCWDISKSMVLYCAIWALTTWQLIAEFWRVTIWYLKLDVSEDSVQGIALLLAYYVVGYVLYSYTIAKWMPDGSKPKVGPRQLGSAILLFIVFEMLELPLSLMSKSAPGEDWKILMLSQVICMMILYLQSELFKKSAMRQELDMLNLLWKTQSEQYHLTRENIALINQKCHDLKHQVRALRNASRENIDKYLEEIEGSIRIYEAVVKTGNEVLDTILTEKSLYCKDREIMVSCVADGSLLDFIDTIDLYAMLGNAIDNAIEAVEKFKNKDKRQIDVMIYRQECFLVINIINPMKESLIYEEELPATTKGDKRYHGYGLRSIRYLVRKYDGHLNVSEEDGCFSLKMLIPIPTT